MKSSSHDYNSNIIARLMTIHSNICVLEGQNPAYFYPNILVFERYINFGIYFFFKIFLSFLILVKNFFPYCHPLRTNFYLLSFPANEVHILSFPANEVHILSFPANEVREGNPGVRSKNIILKNNLKA